MMIMNTTSSMWGDFYKHLDDVKLNSFWEHPTIKQTITDVGDVYKMELLKHSKDLPELPLVFPQALALSFYRYFYYYMTFILPLIEEIGPGPILEVGSGYGGLFAMIRHREPLGCTPYVCVDHYKMLEILTHFTKTNNEGLQIFEDKNIEQLVGRKFKFFISTLTLAETTTEYVNYICEKILPNCDSIFIINSSTYWDVIKKTAASLYNHLRIENYINYKDCRVLIAWK